MAHSRDDGTHAEATGSDGITLQKVKNGVGVFALAALGLFLLQNLQEVDVHFLWFDWSTRMTWALLASAGFGAASALFIGAVARRRRER